MVLAAEPEYDVGIDVMDIRNNPRQAVKPWLKLLEVYHVAGMRAEFEALTRQLNKTFNVKMISWSDFKTMRGGADTIEQIPHVIQRLQELWGTQEAQAYIHQILRDNRNGTRQGFPLTVVEELLLLLAILDDELGTYKPPTELSLVDMDQPSAEDRIMSLLYHPLKNGVPAMASTPISIANAVTGIFFRRPPILRRSCSWWQP